MKLKHLHIPIFAFLLLFSGCVDMLSGEIEEPVRNNPNDLDGTNFLSPEISIVENSVSDGEVTVRWQGGPSNISSQLEYRYSILDFTSDWSPNNTELRDLFANGSYNLQVEARYASLPNNSQARTSQSASINVSSAPSNPHIVLYPRSISTSANQEFTIYSHVLDGVDLFGVNMILNYNSNVFEVVEIGFPDNNLFERNQVDSEKISRLYEEEEQVEFAQVALTNPAEGVDGFGRISMIRLRVRTGAPSGTYSINVNGSSDLRNSNNESIMQGVRGQQITVN